MQNLGDFLEKNDKLIRRSALIMVVVVIGLTIGLRVMPALTSHFNKKTYLSLNFAPASATIAINGETYRNGVYEFEPGTYEISVTADNFISKTYTATVSENSETDVVGYLRCKDKTLECYKENEDDFEVLIQVADDNARDFVETWRKISSIKYIFTNQKRVFSMMMVLIFGSKMKGRVSAAYIENR